MTSGQHLISFVTKNIDEIKCFDKLVLYAIYIYIYIDIYDRATWAPVINRILIEIRSCINNKIHDFLWDSITRPPMPLNAAKTLLKLDE